MKVHGDLKTLSYHLVMIALDVGGLAEIHKDEWLGVNTTFQFKGSFIVPAGVRESDWGLRLEDPCFVVGLVDGRAY